MFGPLLTSAMVDSGSENSMTKKTYISCIKIGGVPILPPLITPEKRLEIEKYRQDAIEVENRIKTSTRSKVVTSKTLENSLAFDHLALVVCDEDKPEDNLVPLQKPLQLSSNIFDVTEYSDNGIVLFNESETCSSSAYVLPEETPQIKSSVELTPSQPRLLRSNSYTLEAPSPILMEHFKKQLGEASDIASPDLSISNIETSLMTLTSSSSYSNSEIVTKKNAMSTTESVNEIIKDLANFQFEEMKSVTKVDAATDYSSDCIEFLHAQAELISMSRPSENEALNTRQQLLIESPSSNGKCCDIATDPMNSSSMLLIDFESDTGENLTFCCDDSSKASIMDSDVCCSPSFINKNRSGCSRVLFDGGSRSDVDFKENWAATVLTAAVRGYLVRRLKCTERVTNLIQTIRDALICAMSLHSETRDEIQPQDVELHRRLIQQISSACYEFYDIFFNLTLKERMEIIALDRQKIKEKLKRPTSAVTLGSSDKMGSSPKGPFNTKQKKALVTSLMS